jgi:deoxyribodipyrimidine photo-lyase
MQQAKDRIWAIRRSAGFDRHADAIQQKHGSRKAGMKPTGTLSTSRRRRSVAYADLRLQQLSLDV